MGGYDHTQRGLLHWLTGGLAVLFVALAAPAAQDEPEAAVVLVVVALLMAAAAACFARLRVFDGGAALHVEFGPWTVFRRRVHYREIEDAQAARSRVIDGWGIHWVPGRGWTWNLHGFDCVELRLSGGRRLRIGTDDPEGLASFLRSRIAG